MRTNRNCPSDRLVVILTAHRKCYLLDCDRAGCVSEQTRKCNTEACKPSEPSFSPPPLAFSSSAASIPSSSSSPSFWTSWTSCTKLCGGGTQIRKRKGTNIAQTQGCNIQPCNSNNFNGNTQTSSITNNQDLSLTIASRPVSRPLSTNSNGPAALPVSFQNLNFAQHFGGGRPRGQDTHYGSHRPLGKPSFKKKNMENSLIWRGGRSAMQIP